MQDIALGRVEWGDVGTWVVGIATVILFALTYATLRLTRKEQMAIHAERLASQAHLVSAWSTRVLQGPGDEPDQVELVLHNASDEPIYGARLAVGATWSDTPTTYVEVGRTAVPFVFGPKQQRPYTVRIRVGRTADGTHSESAPAEIIFADAAGHYWRRDRYGGLTHITRELPPSGAQHFFTTPANVFGGEGAWRACWRKCRACAAKLLPCRKKTSRNDDAEQAD